MVYSQDILHVPGQSEHVYYIPGEINIGCLVGATRFSPTSACSSQIFHSSTTQIIEALRYGVEKVNNQTNILENVTLGIVVVDECSKSAVAAIRLFNYFLSQEQQQTITIESNECTCKKEDEFMCAASDIVVKCSSDSVRQERASVITAPVSGPMYDVVGFICCSYSSVSATVADILTLHDKPQISYSATSDTLSDKTMFPLFARVVPADRLQVRDMMVTIK